MKILGSCRLHQTFSIWLVVARCGSSRSPSGSSSPSSGHCCTHHRPRASLRAGFNFRALVAIVVALSAAQAGTASAGSASGIVSPLPRSSPEAQGVAEAGILDFLETLERRGLTVHSLMLVRDGHVVAEGWWRPYAPELHHRVFSVTKSFTTTAVGLAIAEGRLRLDDPVVRHLQSELPGNVSENLAAMRIEHLLTMTCGHAKNPMPTVRSSGKANWTREILAYPVVHTPGTHFVYNGGSSMLLSAIVQKVTGQTLQEYLRPRIFEPLGIESVDWPKSPEGINDGGAGMRLRTEDLAKFGQLYLQKGQWNGRRLLPEAWVEEATRSHVESNFGPDRADCEQGYGYLFWRGRHDSYWAYGIRSQMCIVMPELRAVLAITGDTLRTQEVHDAVWEHVLPALRGVEAAGRLKKRQSLVEKLSSLTLPPVVGRTKNPLAAAVSGKWYQMSQNELGIQRISLSFAGDTCSFSLVDGQTEYGVTCGLGRWSEMRGDSLAMPYRMFKQMPTRPSRFAASSAWTSENSFTMNWQFVEDGQTQIVQCQFDADRVRLTWGEQGPVLTGVRMK